MTDNETRYFVFDCGKNEKDIEFIIHNWHKGSVQPRATRATTFCTEGRREFQRVGQFYFFGSGKVGRIADDPEDEHGGINCLVDNPIPFRNPVYRE